MSKMQCSRARMTPMLAAAVVWACGATEIASSVGHPASPDAPAARTVAPGALQASLPAFSGHEDHAGHDAAHLRGHEAAPSDDSKPSGVTYTCPMHPEIARKEPGSCPICGMKLVPKKEKN